MSGKQNEERFLNIATGSFGANVQEFSAGDGNAITKITYAYTGAASNIYLYSKKSGINIYGIKVTYPSTPTGIEDVPTNNGVRKIIREGRLLILRDNKVYSILGF